MKKKDDVEGPKKDKRRQLKTYDEKKDDVEGPKKDKRRQLKTFDDKKKMTLKDPKRTKGGN